MGGRSSKPPPPAAAAAPAVINKPVDTQIVTSSSGFHMLEIHAPSVGAALLGLALMVLLVLLGVCLYKRYQRRAARALSRHQQRQALQRYGMNPILLHSLQQFDQPPPYQDLFRLPMPWPPAPVHDPLSTRLRPLPPAQVDLSSRFEELTPGQTEAARAPAAPTAAARHRHTEDIV